MFDVGSIYSLDPYSTSLEEEYKCTGDVYSYAEYFNKWFLEEVSKMK